MQKFTVFSILLSLTLLLVLGDLVVHDYLRSGPSAPAELPQVSEVGSTSVLNSLIPVETAELPEEFVAIAQIEPKLQEDKFVMAGLSDPSLKEAAFSGLIFQFIPFSDQAEALVHQSHLFNGEEFVGTVYEVNYPSETAAFQGYLALRQRANSLTDLGSINETNTYGDSSFYFNHDLKDKTVHLVVRSGESVYAFEYAHVNHDLFKKVVDLL